MVNTENRKFGLGVVLLVLNKNMTKILMLKRNREKRKRWGYTWGNVGGTVEKGELTVDACIREAREETGLILNKKDIKFLSTLEVPDFLPNVHAVHFFYFTTIDDKAKVCLNCESEDCAWFDINKLPEDIVDKDLGKLIKLARSKG